MLVEITGELHSDTPMQPYTHILTHTSLNHNMTNLLLFINFTYPHTVWLCGRYEGCWKAIMHEADGVLLVFNPDVSLLFVMCGCVHWCTAHFQVRGSDQLLNDFFEFFVRKSGLREEQAMIFAHRGNGMNEKIKPREFVCGTHLCLFISLFSLSAHH